MSTPNPETKIKLKYTRFKTVIHAKKAIDEIIDGLVKKGHTTARIIVFLNEKTVYNRELKIVPDLRFHLFYYMFKSNAPYKVFVNDDWVYYQWTDTVTQVEFDEVMKMWCVEW